MVDENCGRRRFLYHAGTVTTIGALAGCSGGNSGGESNGTETEAETTTAVPFSAATDTPAETTSSSPYIEPAPRTVDQFLLNQNPFYDGNMVVGVPFVGVGAGEENTGFDPAAIQVSTGTEVTWEWASGDEPHTVRSIAQTGTGQRTLDSGEPQQGNDITYRYTFEEAGVYRYVCSVHRNRTGRGAVVVVDEPVGVGGDANETTSTTTTVVGTE